MYSVDDQAGNRIKKLVQSMVDRNDIEHCLSYGCSDVIAWRCMLASLYLIVKFPVGGGVVFVHDSTPTRGQDTVHLRTRHEAYTMV